MQFLVYYIIPSPLIQIHGHYCQRYRVNILRRITPHYLNIGYASYTPSLTEALLPELLH